MRNIGAVPPDLLNVMTLDNGYVLTIVGRPGTGKSLLLQEMFRDCRNSIMILSDTENYETTSDVLSKDIVDWENRHILTHHWREVNLRGIETLNLEDQLKNLCGFTSYSSDTKVIFIDSWNDFIAPVPVEEQYRVQQALLYSIRRDKKKLVLVNEVDWSDNVIHPIFYATDGIVILEKNSANNRMYRQVIIEKLRARQIDQDSFLFTLCDGRFTYLPWYEHQYPAITLARDPIPDPSEDRISTGNESLDNMLGGGFKIGHLSLIEVQNMAVPYMETIYIPFLSNHLQLGRPAVILLPEGWSANSFASSLSRFIDYDEIMEQIVFFGRHALGNKGNTRGLDMDPNKILQEMRYEANELQRKSKSVVTELFALDTLENMYGPKVVKGMIAEITAALPGTDRATVTILSQHQALRSESVSCDSHLKVEQLSGVLSVYGINPRTGYQALRPILSEGFLDYNLIPIV